MIQEPMTSRRTKEPVAKSGLRLRDTCDACVQAKVRCSKTKPNCTRCEGRGLVCHYAPSRRYGRPPASARVVDRYSPEIAASGLTPVSPRELEISTEHMDVEFGTICRRASEEHQPTPTVGTPLSLMNPSDPLLSSPHYESALAFSNIPNQPPIYEDPSIITDFVLDNPSFLCFTPRTSISHSLPIQLDMESCSRQSDFTFESTAVNFPFSLDGYSTSTTEPSTLASDDAHCSLDQLNNVYSSMSWPESFEHDLEHYLLTEATEILAIMRGGSHLETAAMDGSDSPLDAMLVRNRQVFDRVTVVLDRIENHGAPTFHVLFMIGLITSEAIAQYSATLMVDPAIVDEDEANRDRIRDFARAVRGTMHHMVHVIETLANCVPKLKDSSPTLSSSPSSPGARYAKGISHSVLKQLGSDLKTNIRQLGERTTGILRSV